MHPFHRKAVAHLLVLAGMMSFGLVAGWEAEPASGAANQIAAAYSGAVAQPSPAQLPASLAAAASQGQLCRPVLIPGAGSAVQCQAVAARTTTML